eukprot:365379-Chlamydomonas_euryale.AAC.6
MQRCNVAVGDQQKVRMNIRQRIAPARPRSGHRGRADCSARRCVDACPAGDAENTRYPKTTPPQGPPGLGSRRHPPRHRHGAAGGFRGKREEGRAIPGRLNEGRALCLREGSAPDELDRRPGAPEHIHASGVRYRAAAGGRSPGVWSGTDRRVGFKWEASDGLGAPILTGRPNACACAQRARGLPRHQRRRQQVRGELPRRGDRRWSVPGEQDLVLYLAAEAVPLHACKHACQRACMHICCFAIMLVDKKCCAAAAAAAMACKAIRAKVGHAEAHDKPPILCHYNAHVHQQHISECLQPLIPGPTR